MRADRLTNELIEGADGRAGKNGNWPARAYLLAGHEDSIAVHLRSYNASGVVWMKAINMGMGEWVNFFSSEYRPFGLSKTQTDS